MECRRDLAMRILSVPPSVRLSVRRSVRQSVNCDKTEEKSVQIFLYYGKEHLAQFSEKKKNGWWEQPLYLKFWVNRPRWSEIADFQPIIARSASAVTPSEKFQLTLIGSPLRAFQ